MHASPYGCHSSIVRFTVSSLLQRCTRGSKFCKGHMASGGKFVSSRTRSSWFISPDLCFSCFGEIKLFTRAVRHRVLKRARFVFRIILGGSTSALWRAENHVLCSWCKWRRTKCGWCFACYLALWTVCKNSSYHLQTHMPAAVDPHFWAFSTRGLSSWTQRALKWTMKWTAQLCTNVRARVHWRVPDLLFSKVRHARYAYKD